MNINQRKSKNDQYSVYVLEMVYWILFLCGILFILELIPLRQLNLDFFLFYIVGYISKNNYCHVYSQKSDRIPWTLGHRFYENCDATFRQKRLP